MPGRQGRGGTESASRGRTAAKKIAAKKSAAKTPALKPEIKTKASKRLANTGVVKAAYGRQDHRHAPEEGATRRGKLKRDARGVADDLTSGAGMREVRASGNLAEYDSRDAITGRYSLWTAEYRLYGRTKRPAH